MIKRYKIENLDCANCARKLEEGIGNLEGVNECKVNFLTQRITLDVLEEKLEEVLLKAQNLAKKAHSKIVLK